MEIRQAYALSARGITGQVPVPRKYYGKREAELMKKTKVRPTQNKNYLDEAIRAKRDVPTAGKYFRQQRWCKDRSFKKVHYEKRICLPEVQQAVRAKVPGVGTYNVVPSEEQLKARLQKLKRSKTMADRTSYLDEVNYKASEVPGVGSYSVLGRPKRVVKSSLQPKDWRRLHKQQDQKKSKKNKAEGQMYYPVPANYSLFQSLSRKMLKPSKFNEYSKSERRFRLEKEALKAGPGSYCLQWQWPGKNQGGTGWQGRVSKGSASARSIYY